MRKKLLAVSWGILFLLGTDHVFADQVSSPFLKLCEAETSMLLTPPLRMGQSTWN